MPKLCESEIEKMAIEELVKLGYTYLSGPDIAPDALFAERNSYSEVLLRKRLTDAVVRLNPALPYDVVLEAVNKVCRISSSNLIADNETFHKMLVDGVPVEYRKNGDIVGDYVKLVDFSEDGVDNNEFLVVNQFTVIENNNNKRPDILLFINGIPMVLFELKIRPMKTPPFAKLMTKSAHTRPPYQVFLHITRYALFPMGWKLRQVH
jgi:type I restriction enzyme R subunit